MTDYNVKFYNRANRTKCADVSFIASSDATAKRKIKKIAQEARASYNPGTLLKSVAGKGYVTIYEWDALGVF